MLLMAAVTLQIGIGIATVHFGIPLTLATLHNAGAATLVVALLWLVRALWPQPRMVPFTHGDRTQ
jgi:cytochrome c oxidase assembly protein subunit 15